MELNKKSLQGDSFADLYRAAFYLSKGKREIGLDFLKKANKQLKNNLSQKISSLLKENKKELESRQHQLFWAEKILDEFQNLRPHRLVV